MTLQDLRKRLSKIWNVAPYRVEVAPYLEGIIISVDGKDPTKEMMDAFAADIQARASEVRRKMN